MGSKSKTLWPFMVLLALSFIFHFVFLSHTDKIVFDEIHFANYAEYYLTGDYYFDIHPPLGKLMLAGLLKLTGTGSNSHNLLRLRFLPALFGSLFVLVVSWLSFLITRSRSTAIIAGFLVLFDNALLTQSRFALMDIFLLFFGALTMCFFFIFLKQKTYDRKWFVFLFLTGIFLGSTISIKWTGIATLGIMVSILLAKVFSEKRKLREAIIAIVIILVFGTTIYTLPFAVHFSILKNFDKQNFPMNQFSYGKREIQQSDNFFQKVETLNVQMLTANLNSTDKNPGSSEWFKWPFNQKPLRYSANVYFKGNTILWLFIAALVLITSVGIFLNKELSLDKTRNKQEERSVFLVLLLGYFANLLPFVFIGRTTFMYHYLPALTFGVILAAYWLNIFLKHVKPVFVIVFTLIIINFLAFLPQSLGLTF